MAAEDLQTQELLDRTTLETLASLGERRGKDLLGQLFGLFLDQGPKSFEALRCEPFIVYARNAAGIEPQRCCQLAQRVQRRVLCQFALNAAMRSKKMF